MRRFSSPLSTRIRPKTVWLPGQYYSLDWIPMGKPSCRGYIGFILIVDAATDKCFKYFTKTENAIEFNERLDDHFQIYHTGKYAKVVKCTHILSDGGSQITSTRLTDYFKRPDIDIHLNLSGPYTQVQNRTERFVQTVKGGIKSCMAYNNAPYWYW